MYGSIDIILEAFVLNSDPIANTFLFVSSTLGKTFVGAPLSGNYLHND